MKNYSLILLCALNLTALPSHEANGQEEIPEPVRSAMGAIVRLRMPEGTGSGFLLPDGMIGSALHCIEGDNNMLKIYFAEAGVLPAVPVVRIDRFLDLAMLKVDPRVLPAWLPWQGLRPVLEPPQPGQIVFALGTETGITRLRVDTVIKGGPLLRLLPVDPARIGMQGDSGGAVVDREGRLVGVIVAGTLEFSRPTDVIAVDAATFMRFQKEGKLPEAYPFSVKDFEEILLWGNHAETYGRTDDVLKLFSRAVQLRPSDTRGYVGLGRAYLRLGDIVRAGAALKKAAELAPDDPYPHEQMAELVQKTRPLNLDNAMRHWQRAVELDPKRVNSLVRIGVVHRQRGRYEEAVRQLRAAIAAMGTIDPAQFDAQMCHAELIGALTDAGKYAEAWHVAKDSRRMGLRLGPSVTATLTTEMAEPRD